MITKTETLKYSGEVKVSLMKDNKVLSSKTYHNTGYPNLSKFICNALAGNYTAGARPCYVVLYNKGSTESATEPNYEASLLITPAVLNDTTAVVKSVAVGNDVDHYTTTFHFRIPYAYLGANAVYKAALVSSSFNHEYASASDELFASFPFTKTVEGVVDWDPINIDVTKAGNYSIIIQWVMTIANQ